MERCLAVLFLAEFPLSTVAPDSSFLSQKTGGGSVVAVSRGRIGILRICPVTLMFTNWLGLPGFCLKPSGKCNFECSIKLSV